MDKINPNHYKSHPSGIECIEIAQHHDFLIGNAIKYLWRAGLKSESTEIEDLKKAVWYIERKIKVLQEFTNHDEPEINLYAFPGEIGGGFSFDGKAESMLTTPCGKIDDSIYANVSGTNILLNP